VFRNGAVTSRLHAYDAGAVTEIDASSESAAGSAPNRARARNYVPTSNWKREERRGMGGGGESGSREEKGPIVA